MDCSRSRADRSLPSPNLGVSSGRDSTSLSCRKARVKSCACVRVRWCVCVCGGACACACVPVARSLRRASLWIPSSSSPIRCVSPRPCRTGRRAPAIPVFAWSNTVSVRVACGLSLREARCIYIVVGGNVGRERRRGQQREEGLSNFERIPGHALAQHSYGASTHTHTHTTYAHTHNRTHNTRNARERDLTPCTLRRGSGS